VGVCCVACVQELLCRCKMLVVSIVLQVYIRVQDDKGGHLRGLLALVE
jgi:hypothetical protein